MKRLRTIRLDRLITQSIVSLFLSRSLGRANFFNSTHLHSWGLFSTDWSISKPKFTFLTRDTLLTRNRFNYSERSIMKNGKRRTWTTDDVRTLKSLARKKTRAGKIAKTLKRSEGATRQKAFSLGVSLDARV